MLPIYNLRVSSTFSTSMKGVENQHASSNICAFFLQKKEHLHVPWPFHYINSTCSRITFYSSFFSIYTNFYSWTLGWKIGLHGNVDFWFFFFFSNRKKFVKSHSEVFSPIILLQSLMKNVIIISRERITRIYFHLHLTKSQCGISWIFLPWWFSVKSISHFHSVMLIGSKTVYTAIFENLE